METAHITRNSVQFTDFSKFLQLEYFGNLLGLFMNHQLFCGKIKAKKYHSVVGECTPSAIHLYLSMNRPIKGFMSVKSIVDHQGQI